MATSPIARIAREIDSKGASKWVHSQRIECERAHSFKQDYISEIVHGGSIRPGDTADRKR